MKEIDKNSKTFEDIKHIDENGIEFWYAREIMEVLQYSKWQNFEKIIDKAKNKSPRFVAPTSISLNVLLPKILFCIVSTVIIYRLQPRTLQLHIV